MKCPHCQGQAITFGQWGQGANAFRTACRSCGKKLKATRATYVAALASFAVILAALFIIVPVAKSSGVSNFTLKHGLALGLAVAVCGVAYRFCGYEKAE